MSVSLFSLAYPVRNVWAAFTIPYVGNESVVWKGEVAVVVDANGEVFQTDALVFDTPWYHCAPCGERLSLGANFCPKCGVALDWLHMEKDPEAEAKFQADVNAKVKEARASAETEA